MDEKTERAAFEAWISEFDCGSKFERSDWSDYDDFDVQRAWAGWQARAALAAAPAPHPDTADAERYRWLRNESWGGQAQRMRYPCVIVFDGAGNRKTMLAEEAMDTAIDAARAQTQKVVVGHNLAKCNKALRAAGKVYPRTCAECGLGPCRAQAQGGKP